MKLRLQENSIRFRLASDEPAKLMDDCRIENFVQFGPRPDERLTYFLELHDKGDPLRVVYEPGRIRVLILDSEARELAETNRLGVEATFDVADGTRLHVVVEKDLKG